MNYDAMTDIGKVRTKNQDQATVMANLKDQIMAIVCDGMGGHRAGEIASRVVIDYFAKCFDSIPPFESVDELKKWLNDTIIESDDIVKRMAKQTVEHHGMGTTVVVAILMNNRIYISHVGDSRAYILKNNELNQMTKDHTLVNELINQGLISEVEAKNHSKKNVLTQAIGAQIEITPSFIDVEFDNSLLLLCSDGLYNCLSEEEILEILQKDTKVSNKVIELIELANKNGGFDNIGVAIIDNREEK